MVGSCANSLCSSRQLQRQRIGGDHVTCRALLQVRLVGNVVLPVAEQACRKCHQGCCRNSCSPENALRCHTRTLWQQLQPSTDMRCSSRSSLTTQL